MASIWKQNLFIKFGITLKEHILVMTSLTPCKRPMIEDISCVGYDTPVFLYHRNILTLKLTSVFKKKNSMDDNEASAMCGKSISTGYL